MKYKRGPVSANHFVFQPSKIFFCLPNFLVNLSIPYFREGRNNVASFIGKIRLRTPMEQVVLSDRSRFWTRQIWPQQQSKYYDATPPAQQILKAANFSANQSNRK